MNMIIVFKPDGGLVRIWPNKKYGVGEGKIPYEQCKALKQYTDLGYEWQVIDASEFPDKSGLESRKQIYHENKVIKTDPNWEKRIMPCHVIVSKEKNYLENEIVKESEKQNPDNSAINALLAKKIKVEKYDLKENEKEIYELALSNLSRSDKDTTVIEQKLNEKINELTTKKEDKNAT